MTDFLSLCMHRRSIRHYADRPVEQEKLDYILRCALTSPSAKRQNPWEFVVITDPEMVHSLAACKSAGSNMLTTAQAAIAVVLNPDLLDTWQADGGIAAEQIMLAATEQGLGSCWCHTLDRENAENFVREKLGIPASMRVLCLIALGYRDEERQDYDLAKLLYDKIHYGRY